MTIRGNLSGLREATIEKINSIFEIEIPRTSFATSELIDQISYFTSQINREISVYIDRFGSIIDVAVGDDKSVSLENLSRRRGVDRLSGIRCIHTHPNGNPALSSVDINALISLRFDGMCAVGVQDGKCTGVNIAYIEVIDASLSDKVKFINVSPKKIENDILMNIVFDIEKSINLTNALYNLDEKKERVILVGVKMPDDEFPEEESIEELADLVETAGGEVIHKLIQPKHKVDRVYYIGSGKAEELKLMAQAMSADTIVFDHELSPIQMKHLELVTGTKIIDRTTLILDIFAQRAISNEGKLQVELAQLKFRLPRLLGLGLAFSQQGGGIGSKGPGEKKLETDRRHIMRKIEQLQKDLKEIKKNRDVQRKQRKESGIPNIALVGYTNAGKSTLLNSLCNSDVLAEDKLFATLDPTTRKLELPDDGQAMLFTDTVGFINKLPHTLINAFKSTLEETIYADLLIHVIDVSNSSVEYQINTVEQILKELEADKIPIITVLNKIDKVDKEQYELLLNKYKDIFKDALTISAKNMQGIDKVIDLVKEKIGKEMKNIRLQIPYDKAAIENKARDLGKINNIEYGEEYIFIDLLLPANEVYKIDEYVIS